MRLNQKASKKTRLLISLHHADVSGAKNPMFGKTHNQKARQSIAKANRERIWTEESRTKQGLAHKGIKQNPDWIEKRIKFIRGANHYNWKGGKRTENQIIRASHEYKLWRTAVFERDDYTCQTCGARNGNGKSIYLEADHIKQFAFYPELRFDLSNGRTLCKDCHRRQGRPTLQV